MFSFIWRVKFFFAKQQQKRDLPVQLEHTVYREISLGMPPCNCTGFNL